MYQKWIEISDNRRYETDQCSRLQNHRCHLFYVMKVYCKMLQWTHSENLQISEYRYDEVLESDLNIVKFTVALRRDRWHTIWWKIENVIVFKWWLKKCVVHHPAYLSIRIFIFFSYEMSGQKSSLTQSSKINYFISFPAYQNHFDILQKFSSTFSSHQLISMSSCSSSGVFILPREIAILIWSKIKFQLSFKLLLYIWTRGI